MSERLNLRSRTTLSSQTVRDALLACRDRDIRRFTVSEVLSAAVPKLAPETPLRVPEPVDMTFPNGLRLFLLRRPGVPLVELRLCLPGALDEPAVTRLAAATMFSGTADATLAQLAHRVQAVGGSIRAETGPDGMTITGSGLASGLAEFLAVLSEIAVGANFPQEHLEAQRTRTVDLLSVAERTADLQAARALESRLWGGHPYGRREPKAAEVLTVEREAVLDLHRSLFHPVGAHLVIVGDFDIDQAANAVEKTLGSWIGGRIRDRIAPLPHPRSGPIVLVDRPGSVQSSIRIACPAVDRTHPDNAAQHLADVVYGGFGASRLVMNLREGKGFGYSVRSKVDQLPAGSLQTTSVDVATEVTAPALAEIFGELRGMAQRPPDEVELNAARAYALGSIKLSLTTQSGMASCISWLAQFDLRLCWLAELFERLRDVTGEDVQRVSEERMNPDRAVAVVLGDRAWIAEPLAAAGRFGLPE